MSPSDRSNSEGPGRLPLEDVLTIEELARRPSRPPLYEAENRALVGLMQALADAPGDASGDPGRAAAARVLQKLAETALRLCRADSCGVSILEEDAGREVFRWHASAGEWAGLLKPANPRESSPSGAVLDRNQALLMSRPERHYGNMAASVPPLVEALLVPIHCSGKPVGTVWLVMHDESRQFDAEDLRLVTSLSRSAAMAYQLLMEHQHRLDRELLAMQRLHELVSRLLVCPDKHAALDEVLDAVVEITDADMGTVRVLNEDGTLFRVVAQRGFDEAILDRFRVMTIDDDPACGQALRSGERVLIEDVRSDHAYEPLREVATAAGFQAMQATPLVSRDGKLLGVLSTHYRGPTRATNRDLRILDVYTREAADFLEAKAAEDALRDRSKQFEMLLNQAPLGVYVVDADFRIRHVNPVAMPIFGDLPGGVLDRDFEEILRLIWPRDFADEVTRIFRRALTTGASYYDSERAEHRLDRGVPEYYEWRVERIRLPDERYGVVCYFRDVSEQVRARLEIAASEQRYRTLFNSIDEGFCVLEVLFDAANRPHDYRFLEVNPAFEKQTGLVNVEGRRIRELAPTHEEHWFEIYGRIARTREAVRFERVANALGRHYDVYAFPFGAPEEMRVAVLFSDVTKRKRAEEALKAADERKNEFLAMLGHELRNPLAPIRSGLDILSMNERGENRQTIELMQAQVEHLVRLVDDLLDVSRIMRGKIELRRNVVPLADLIRRSVKATAGLFDLRQQELHVVLPEAPVWVDADPVRLVQIFDNLLTNASKYTDVGGRIDLTAEVLEGRATVRVRDTGVGIEPTFLPHIFDLFTQARRSLERAEGGLGIGLSLVKQLVDLHGGEISVESAGVGEGSTFVVRLPTVAAPAQPVEHTEHRAATRNRRVLVVDDNVAAAEMFAVLLAKLGGHHVEMAHDGASALEKIRRTQPEIVLLDIGLPGMDGYHVAEEIRRERRFDDLLLIAVTGYGQKEDRERSREAGFDEHLVKPPSVEQLSAIFAHPKLFREGRPDRGAAGTLQGPHAPSETGPLQKRKTRVPVGGPRDSLHSNLRQIKHDIANTAFALKMVVQMLSDPSPSAELMTKLTNGLYQEANSLEQLVAKLQRAIDEIGT